MQIIVVLELVKGLGDQINQEGFLKRGVAYGRVLKEEKGIGRRMYMSVAAESVHLPHPQSDAESIIFFFLFVGCQ